MGKYTARNTAYMKKWREENREKYRAYQAKYKRAYREAGKDKSRAKD